MHDEMTDIMHERVLIPGPAGLLSGELAYAEWTPAFACLFLSAHPHMGGCMDNPVVARSAAAVAACGGVSLRFDYAGVGQSQGTAADVAASMAAFWVTGRAPEDPRMVDDGRAALCFLCRSVVADPGLPVVLVGYSFGAFVATSLAADGPDRPMALVSPTLTHHDFAALRTGRAPLLWVHSDNDFATPAAVTRSFIGTLRRPCRTLCLPGADHFFRGREADVGRAVADFACNAAGAAEGGCDVLRTSTAPSVHAAAPSRESVAQRLRRVVEAHFHPTDGSVFWLDRAAALGVDPLRQIHAIDDLALLGEMTPQDLDRRPLADYVPRRFHRRMDQWVVGQTGGTTGGGTWAAYRQDEFVEAFVLPFVAAAAHVGFPARRQWLFVGPGGPHIIGKVTPQLAAAVGSPDPFSVDFDPRWAKRLPEGSFARQRYLAHVVAQAMDVIRRQDVGVLFSTPPVLEALAGQMTEAQRLRVAGVHYGGMAIDPRRLARFQAESFPAAVHLCGYGNTLFGCGLELSVGPGRQLDYYPFGNRLIVETVDEGGTPVAVGETGQVRFTRLDETMLIVRMRQRDVAEAVPPPEGAPADFALPGLRNPGPRAADAAKLAVGLY